jgi:hypothetical protein
MSYFVLIDIYWSVGLNSSPYLYLHFFISREREINHHLVPFFDIPISIEAPTRAVYIYIYTYKHTHALVDMFVLSFTYSFIHSFLSFCSLTCTTSNECCVSVKAKLVLTNRNIACDMYVRVCADRADIR